MRISKEQIINGIADYIRQEVLPRMSNDKAVQIVLSVGVNAVKANTKLVDAVFGHEIVKAMLQDDGSGMYEIGGMMDAIRDSVEQYGYFPITVPQIPLISPRVIEMKLTADDVDAMRERIENAE